ncbi:MAG: MurR/RpiR family transcriptional regulator [Lachnospiraceae bacterium]|nr:MurR/RpiR family transcriptional regulator [Lachnospiraceae bacterium]
MLSENDLLNRINRKYKSMSKGQKALANYITEDFEKAVFYTANELGEVVSVSESTVIRFAKNLGYKGYPELIEAMQEMVKSRLDSGEPGRMSFNKISQGDELHQILTSDSNNILETLKLTDPRLFLNALDIIDSAKKIYVIGIRSCAPLAQFLAFYLNLIYPDVILLSTTNSSEIFEQMLRINERDVMIGISFPRYSMRTLKALELASTKNARVITISDSVSSPLNLYSSCNLVAKSDMASIVDSLVAPMSLINAIIVALCKRRQAQVSDNLNALSELWDEYQYYENDELDPVSYTLDAGYNDITQDKDNE